MMFRRFLKSKFLKRSVIIITLTAVFTAVFSIFIVGFSAEEYTQVIPDSFDIMRIISNSTGDFDIYNNSGSSYWCKTGTTSSVSNLTYGTTPLANIPLSVHENSLYAIPYYFEKISGTTQFAYDVLLPFEYMVKGGDEFKFAINSLDNSYSVSIQVLTTDGDLLDCSFTRIQFGSNTQPSYSYFTWYLTNYQSKYKYARKNNGSTFTGTGGGGIISGCEFFVTLPGDTYYSIDRLVISISTSNSSTYNIRQVGVEFASLPPYYEAVPTGDGDYSAQFSQVIAQLEDVNNKLDVITGEMPSEAASEQAAYNQQQAQLQGDIQDVEDKFSEFEDEIEWNRRYPEVNQEDVQPVYSSAVTNFFSFLYDPTELIPRLIAFGSSMLILFTVFKRF